MDTIKAYLVGKYYSCPDCDFQNANPERLIAHLGKKSDLAFDCEICGKIYCTKIGLKYHISRSHGSGKEDKFGCNLCKSAYGTRFALSRHQKLKHKESVIKLSL